MDQTLFTPEPPDTGSSRALTIIIPGGESIHSRSAISAGPPPPPPRGARDLLSYDDGDSKSCSVAVRSTEDPS